MDEDPIRDAMMAELMEIVDHLRSEGDGAAIDFHFFADDTVVEIHTDNSIYRLQVLDCNQCVVLATGDNRYLLETTRCRVNGCTWGGSIIKLRHVVIGMHLELEILDTTDGKPLVRTSPIRRIVFRVAP